MAAPLIAGYLGRVKLHYPEADVSELKNRLYGTSLPVTVAATGAIANPAQAGTGLIQPQAAIQSQVLVEPTLVTLRDTGFAMDPEPQCIELTYYIAKSAKAISNFEMTFILGHIPTSSINAINPAIPGSYTNSTPDQPEPSPPSTTFSTNVFTLSNKDPSATVTVCITAPSFKGNPWLYGGHILATPRVPHDAPTLKSTYMGLLGSMTIIPTLTINGTYPFIQSTSDNYTIRSGAQDQDMKTLSLPGPGVVGAFIVFHLSVPVESVVIELRDAKTRKQVGRTGQREFLGRNGGTYPFYRAPWDGTVERGPLVFPKSFSKFGGSDWKYRNGGLERAGNITRPPSLDTENRVRVQNGTYFIRIIASRQENVEVWNSPIFKY
jgi:hypothetical protein